MADGSVNRLHELASQGQSVWLDFISRRLIDSGELERLIAEDGITGMTSNPTIFQKAIVGSDDYDGDILQLAREGLSAEAVFDRLAVIDVRRACDALRVVHEASEGADGYVSIEVAPALAHDGERTAGEVRRLRAAVDRPNLLVKIPATTAGVPAVRRSLADGYSVNITLMFSMAHYEAVAEAYIAALEERLAAGQPLRPVASVASFFVSRVDTLVDKLIDERLAAGPEAPQRELLEGLRGQAAVANSKLVYERFAELLSSDRWRRLAAAGARPQRVLWASTSTKNRAYSDVLYVDNLIGPHTVNTLPPETVAAFRDHGRVERTVDRGLAEAHGVMERLATAGIDMAAVTEQLQTEGVAAFAASFDGVVASIAEKRQVLLGDDAVGRGE